MAGWKTTLRLLPYKITNILRIIESGKARKSIDSFNLNGLTNQYLSFFSNEEKILKLFNDQLVLFLESNTVYHVEASENRLLVFKNERLLSPSEIKAMAYFGRELVSLIECNFTS